MRPLPIHKIHESKERQLNLSRHQIFERRFRFHNRVYTNWKAVANLDKHKCRLLIFN